MLLKQLWQDEAGALLSAEVMLIGTILVIGVITGLTSLRDAVITELADLGAAIAAVDQSYTIHNSTSHSSGTASSRYNDLLDFCDNGTTTDASRCLVICGGTFAVNIGTAGGDGG